MANLALHTMLDSDTSVERSVVDGNAACRQHRRIASCCDVVTADTWWRSAGTEE